MSEQAKVTLLRSCKGIPRDLIKNVDFALAGDFDAEQLDALLGNISDELLFSVLCSLKSQTIDFVSHIEDLINDAADNKLSALRDFWLRYLLERASGTKVSLTTEMINELDKIFSVSDINKVTKVLLRATTATLLLELINLNMTLVGSTGNDTLGHQKDAAQSAASDTRVRSQLATRANIPEGGKVDSGKVKKFVL